MKKVLIDLTGQRFGRLLVVARAPNGNGNKARWECLCDCGAHKVVGSRELRIGTTASCKCLHKELMAARLRTHGMKDAPEYHVWHAMLRRCRDPRIKGYDRYGGRGIIVCERWNDFANFIADMGRRPSSSHTIEREDNDQGYNPDNCVWATRTTQARNKSNNHYIVYKGQRVTIDGALEMAGHPVTRKTVAYRLRHGWPVEKAVEDPPWSSYGAHQPR